MPHSFLPAGPIATAPARRLRRGKGRCGGWFSAQLDGAAIPWLVLHSLEALRLAWSHPLVAVAVTATPAMAAGILSGNP